MSMNDLLTAKQQEVLHAYLYEDFKTMILTGAVRSGKTFIDNLLFLYELKRVKRQAELKGEKHPLYILAGASSGSIKDNIIVSIGNDFGIDMNPDKHNHYHLFGVDIKPVYTKSIGGLAGARGFNAYGAYINEASLAHPMVFSEILSRCSEPGSHVIADTNPDAPTHWLKTDYIDNKNPKNKTLVFTFTMDENTFLAPDYVEQKKAQTPTGMFYDREILGLWVSGDGAVYRDFDERKMVVPDDEIKSIKKYVAGVDWGYQHYGSIVVFGLDDANNWYLVEEHTEQYKEIDYWTKIAHQLQKKYGREMPFYCDTARTEHIDHFKHEGINAQYGWKSVVPGIEIVARQMKAGHFFVKRSAPVKFLDEIYNYRWDDKTEDAVVKENDDCMDACRYAIATYLHMKERKTYHPTSNDREGILRGMRELGL